LAFQVGGGGAGFDGDHPDAGRGDRERFEVFFADGFLQAAGVGGEDAEDVLGSLGQAFGLRGDGDGGRFAGFGAFDRARAHRVGGLPAFGLGERRVLQLPFDRQRARTGGEGIGVAAFGVDRPFQGRRGVGDGGGAGGRGHRGGRQFRGEDGGRDRFDPFA